MTVAKPVFALLSAVTAPQPATLSGRALTPFICHGACLCNFHHLEMPGTFEKGVQAPEADTGVHWHSFHT